MMMAMWWQERVQIGVILTAISRSTDATLAESFMFDEG